jgi:hypothetical protein
MGSARRWSLLTLAVVAGCGESAAEREQRAYACERGFRAADWRAEPLMTAQSIARCGWLDGWSERRLVRALGRPHDRHRRYRTWWVDSSAQGLGPHSWALVVEVDGRRVTKAATDLQAV